MTKTKTRTSMTTHLAVSLRTEVASYSGHGGKLKSAGCSVSAEYQAEQIIKRLRHYLHWSIISHNYFSIYSFMVKFIYFYL